MPSLYLHTSSTSTAKNWSLPRAATRPDLMQRGRRSPPLAASPRCAPSASAPRLAGTPARVPETAPTPTARPRHTCDANRRPLPPRTIHATASADLRAPHFGAPVATSSDRVAPCRRQIDEPLDGVPECQIPRCLRPPRANRRAAQPTALF
ncbi:hypothetical protein VPH35_072039 [Triticum aestivum]|uniref:Uncharacterized protein n=1 Tax=Triticum turgidum subsp. durum TaxID=4567 RepID=A0A9R0SY31_TRITD|nr:unnamed protein product [Triticum turgidum subsp. durum]